MHSSAQTAPDDINRILHDAMVDETLELPPPPQVVLEVMRLTRGDAAGADNADAAAADLARLIQRDIALAAQVMRVANSAVYARIPWSRCPGHRMAGHPRSSQHCFRRCTQGPGVLFGLLSQ